MVGDHCRTQSRKPSKIPLATRCTVETDRKSLAMQRVRVASHKLRVDVSALRAAQEEHTATWTTGTTLRASQSGTCSSAHARDDATRWLRLSLRTAKRTTQEQNAKRRCSPAHNHTRASSCASGRNRGRRPLPHTITSHLRLDRLRGGADRATEQETQRTRTKTASRSHGFPLRHAKNIETSAANFAAFATQYAERTALRTIQEQHSATCNTTTAARTSQPDICSGAHA